MYGTEQRRIAIETFIRFDHGYADTIAELCDALDGSPAGEKVTQERFMEWQIVARRAIEASLELADELEAA